MTLFGASSNREIRKISVVVDKIEALRDKMLGFSDDQLKHKTIEFRNRLRNGDTLDNLLPEAFAVVREASRRVLGLEHYRVQLIGGVILYRGQIAEMATGEGKTLVAALPSYLMALCEKGVHVVTVNDYLAKRDADEIGQIHSFLGLSVGCVLSDMETDDRRAAYACDITYVTNNELGFDYLRDNMAVKLSDRVQRSLYYCIIDEVDSILIDEARTPLIISGMANESKGLYELCNQFVQTLQRGSSSELSKIELIAGESAEESGDYIVDEKDKFVHLTEAGVKKAESFFHISNLADVSHLDIQHHIIAALKAWTLMHKDKDYVVKDDEVLIVDEFTGRIMPGRRYADGLHQAIEVKENVEIKRESRTLATITLQNFFNKYEIKSGMTGTAMTEALEFKEIYQMKVISVPTNRPVVRQDLPDVVYLTKQAKYQAIVDKVRELHEKKQPVLVGTATIEVSELLSRMLAKVNVPHQVLNAKFHEKEADIVSHAGEAGAVTIATNMAGRGTDIKLDDAARTCGGLYVLGTERHESRRIDNQLRGRSGRQGDVGTSCFYVSLEDDVLRLFGSQAMLQLFQNMGLDESQPVAEKGMSKSILRAQKRIEGNHFGVRKSLTDFDEVNNEQRELIYEDRDLVLTSDDISELVHIMIESLLEELVSTLEWSKLRATYQKLFGRILPYTLNHFFLDENLVSVLIDMTNELYDERETEFTAPVMREIEKQVMLQAIDVAWIKHMNTLEQLKQGIGLVGYAQRDPVVEYRMQAFEAFDEMLSGIRKDAARMLFTSKWQSVSSK